MSAAYRPDPKTGVYSLAKKKDFSYSDGLAQENGILTTLQGARDLSVYSQELASSIHDWPTRYHFSAQRAALLWPFRDFLKGKDVLEIGSGCGAITRAMAEFGAHIVALEGSARRAAITAARCRDLKHVAVYNDNFDNFDLKRQFDVVTLIGVLEYAASYITGDDPYVVMLRKVRHFLRPGGVLILAIENRLGLKYLNGVPEDHIGTQFGGLEDAYDGTNIRTFGRVELSGKLQEAGFLHQEFHLPFPDYKFPTLIIHPAAFSNPKIRISDLIFGNADGPTAAEGSAHFYAERAWATLSKNNLVEAFSNSFLVLASAEKLQIGGSILSSRVAPNRQRKKFSATVIKDQDSAGLVVQKFNGFLQPCDEPQTTNAYVEGRMNIERVFKAFQRGFYPERIADAFLPWINFLKKSVVSSDDMLPASHFDCTPWNLLETKDGLVFFDREDFAGDASLFMVAFRGMAHALGMIRYVHCDCPIPVLDLVKEIWLRIFGDVSRLDIPAFLAREYRMLCDTVSQPPRTFEQYQDLMNQAVLIPFAGDYNRRILRSDFDALSADFTAERAARGKLADEYAGLEKAFASESEARNKLVTDYRKLEGLFLEERSKAERSVRELAELKSGFSWRITAPLRIAKRRTFKVCMKLSNLRSRWLCFKNDRKMFRALRDCEVVFDHNLGGGANNYRVQYIAQKVRKGTPCVVVYNNMCHYQSRDFTLEIHGSGSYSSLILPTWGDCRLFLDRLRIKRIVYNNLVFNPAVPEILNWIGTHCARLLMMVHDFYAICPYFLMVNGSGHFCENKGDCKVCGKTQSETRHLYGCVYSREEWKALWAPLFNRAEEIRVFSPFASNLIESAYPHVRGRTMCIPHDMGYFKMGPVDLPAGDGPRIGIVGNLYNVAKGTRIAQALSENLPPGEVLTLVGMFSGDAGARIRVTGRYKSEELPELLQKHGINIVLFPSVCPETFSFTVSELMQMKVPVIAFDIGAQGDKVSHYDRGMIIPEESALSIMATAEKLYNKVYGKERR